MAPLEKMNQSNYDQTFLLLMNPFYLQQNQHLWCLNRHRVLWFESG